MNSKTGPETNGIEKRRVQRLGASSLIVTLPKKWANILGIRVGDTVYLKLSKGHIKIIPGHLFSKEPVSIIRIGEDLPEELARVAASCLYILGVDEAVIDLSEVENREDLVLSIKSIAQELIGMDVLEKDGKLIVKVFIDKKKIDIDTIITNYKNLFLHIITLIMKIVNEKKPVDRELEVVKRDLVRYQHLLLRIMKQYNSSIDARQTTVCSVSAGTYLGMAVDSLIGTADVLNEALKRGALETFTVDIDRLLNESGELINLMIENIVSPKPESITQLRRRTRIMFDDLENLLVGRTDLTRSDYIVLSSIMQFARVITIYTNVVACRFVETIINKEGESWSFF